MVQLDDADLHFQEIWGKFKVSGTLIAMLEDKFKGQSDWKPTFTLNIFRNGKFCMLLLDHTLIY